MLPPSSKFSLVYCTAINPHCAHTVVGGGGLHLYLYAGVPALHCHHMWNWAVHVGLGAVKSWSIVSFTAMKEVDKTSEMTKSIQVMLVLWKQEKQH